MTSTSLRRFSQVHLRYEIDMFVAMAAVLRLLVAGRLEAPADVKNALIEGFALHLRNLIDFLYLKPNPKQPDDVLADHYVAKIDEWHKARRKMPRKLERAKIRANKQVAHLTRLRYRGSARQKQWDVAGLPALLVPRLKKFARHASPQKLHRDVRERIEAL